MRDFVLSSESVTAGHPDKLCDQISDAVVDACLASPSPIGCVAECAIASGVVFLSIRHSAPLDFDPGALARRVLAEAGYDQPRRQQTTVMLDTVETRELSGRLPSDDQVAGHMTTAFGYAGDQTAELMPWPIWAAHRLSAAITAAQHDGTLAWLSPDALVQVAVRFADRRPVAVSGIAMTVFSGEEGPPDSEVIDSLREAVIEPAFAGTDLGPDAKTRLVIHSVHGHGGPRGHAGLTGRKSADDGYGGFARQGSSALSGKDPSRIDRIAAYAARQAAASVVAAGLARECEVQLSYVAGDRGPASVEVDSFGSGQASDAEIGAALRRSIDMRIGAINDRLGLWDLPKSRGGRFFRDVASHGHFGRSDLNLPWDAPVRLT